MTPASPRRRQDLLRSGEYPVALCDPDVGGQVQEVLGVEPAELVIARVATKHGVEGGAGHLRVGLTGRAVLADIGGDAVAGMP